MNCKKLIVPVLGAGLALGTLFAFAETKENAKPAAGQPEMKLPPGWTQEDMQACMVAATPGEMHKRMAKDVGTWQGKSTFWMFPDAEPVKSESTATISPVMDGRYFKCDWQGEMPGMGQFTGFGIAGFDNAAGKFVQSWADSMSTGIMQGTGTLSPDGKSINWTFNYTCPLTKKPLTMRQIETVTGENTKTLEMFGQDPKSGKEFKMMVCELTRK